MDKVGQRKPALIPTTSSATISKVMRTARPDLTAVGLITLLRLALAPEFPELHQRTRTPTREVAQPFAPRPGEHHADQCRQRAKEAKPGATVHALPAIRPSSNTGKAGANST